MKKTLLFLLTASIFSLCLALPNDVENPKISDGNLNHELQIPDDTILKRSLQAFIFGEIDQLPKYIDLSLLNEVERDEMLAKLKDIVQKAPSGWNFLGFFRHGSTAQALNSLSIKPEFIKLAGFSGYVFIYYYVP